jgi:hypothetical protein
LQQWRSGSSQSHSHFEATVRRCGTFGFSATVLEVVEIAAAVLAVMAFVQGANAPKCRHAASSS